MLYYTPCFTPKSAPGRPEAALAELNWAFVCCLAALPPGWSDHGDIFLESCADRIAEQLLAAFDLGKRGADLVEAGCLQS